MRLMIHHDRFVVIIGSSDERIQRTKKEKRMFQIQQRTDQGSVMGNWLTIFESTDGADAAEYLKNLSTTEKRPNVGYRMIFRP